jgi:hypothetical protein
VNGDHDENSRDFQIPDPPSLDAEAADINSLLRALQEEADNRKGTLENARRGIREWNLRYWLKILLFIFVVCLNVWWDTRVATWIWYSGYVGGHFHLSDTVLVALASTSTANFLALILIIAKHLFPSDK